MTAETQKQYEQRMIKEILALPDRLDGMAKQLRSANKPNLLTSAILDTDKELKNIQSILSEIKKALELDDDATDSAAIEITNVNYPSVQQAVQKSLLDEQK